MKVREVLKRLNDEGWKLARTRGSHRVFKHDQYPARRVVVAGKPGEDVPIGTLVHIYEQAGWEDRP